MRDAFPGYNTPAPTDELLHRHPLTCPQALHTLAGDGRTVVFSIHQPRSTIYDMFGDLLLLSEGRLCYAGPAAAAAAYFAAAGHSCPPGHGVADFLLDITSVDFRSPEAEAASRARVGGLADLCALHGTAADKVRQAVLVAGACHTGAGPSSKGVARTLGCYIRLNATPADPCHAPVYLMCCRLPTPRSRPSGLPLCMPPSSLRQAAARWRTRRSCPSLPTTPPASSSSCSAG